MHGNWCQVLIVFWCSAEGSSNMCTTCDLVSRGCGFKRLVNRSILSMKDGCPPNMRHDYVSTSQKNGAPPKMEITLLPSATSESVRHATSSPNVNNNDSNLINSAIKLSNYSQLHPSTPTLIPKLQPSAPILKSQFSSQLRSSSQPFLRQLTLSSLPIESPAQVSVHDTFSSTSSQSTTTSSLHKPSSPPTISSNYSRPSSSEFSLLLSPLSTSRSCRPSFRLHS